MIKLALGAALAAGLAASAAQAESQDAGLYLYVIPASRAQGESGALNGAVFADLYVSNPGNLIAQIHANSNLTVMASDDHHVRVSVADGDTLSGAPIVDHRAASFVIDYDQPAVVSLVDTMRAEIGANPSITDLVDFADASITSKSYRRFFDVASQVAGSREGDCTEHAVLLTALARAAGRSARIALGVMLLEHDGQLMSFGHSWVEIHDGQKWHIADATRPDQQVPGARIRYLPLLELDNEGPGYSMTLMELAAIQPERIDAVHNAPSEM